MQIPPVTSASTSAQTQQTTNTTAQKEKKSDFYVSDIVNFTKKPVSHQVGIGIITLGSAIAGFRSAKSIVFKAINTLIMAVIGFAGGVGLTEAADKFLKDKKTAKAEKTEQKAAPASQSAEKKPEVKPEEKPADTAKTEKNDDKDDDKD